MNDQTWPAMSIAAAHAILTAPGMPFEMEEKLIRGVSTRVWKNAPPTLRDVFELGRAHGDRIFLTYEDDRASFDAFARAALTLAAQLQADGVVKGDRVAIVMRNLPEWPVAYFAAILCGAIVTPLNAWWTGPELEYGLTDSGAKIVLVDAERLGRLAEHLAACPDLKRVYVCRTSDEIAHPLIGCLEDVIGTVNEWRELPDRAGPDVAIDPEDDATIFYTSGTTGKPKGALATHRNIVSNIMASGCSVARSYLRRGEQPPPPDPNAPQKATLLSVPFFHATGCFAVLGPSLAAGSKLCLMRKFEAEAAMRIIERERVTSAGGVPTIAWQLLEHPARHRYDLSSLETVSYGGAPSAPELVRKIKEAWPKSQPGNGWGMTETSATFTHHMAEDYLARPDSCGPAVPVCDMKIVDPATGAELAPGEVGELWGKGPNVVKGYWNKPEATAQTFVDGWVKTGDLARIDAEGFCFIIDRAKDMLIRGGENIYCIEVENCLYEHAAIMDAAVVGIPHKMLGEEPAAVVTLKPDASATEAELRAHVAEHLAAFKVPVKVLIRHDTLPRNANGKILKNELKTLFPWSSGGPGSTESGYDPMRCIVLLAVGAASCGPAADPPAARDGAAIGADAAEIARSLEVTPAEAARRLRAQAVLGDHLARLRVAHANRLAGVYYQHHPGFSAVVRLKGNAPVRAHPLNRSPVDGAPIEFRPGASMTLDELQAARDRHADALRAIQGLQGHGIDERTGTVRLTVHAPGREGAVGSRIADLQARLGLPLTVDFVPDPVIAGTVGSR